MGQSKGNLKNPVNRGFQNIKKKRLKNFKKVLAKLVGGLYNNRALSKGNKNLGKEAKKNLKKVLDKGEQTSYSLQALRESDKLKRSHGS